MKYEAVLAAAVGRKLYMYAWASERGGKGEDLPMRIIS